ncbi:MAG TPA: DUF6600 domain-containing protein [Thermoanaerobaculia bacterium]|nr:DUF6600 domain-containing protein [Thermoanaerobaculia bacterium]
MIPLDRSLVRVGLALGLLALTALPAAASGDESYGYFRVIEGSATLMQASGDNTDRQPAEINQPVLAGDRIWVSSRSRAEIVLADRNILRLDGDSEVTLEQLAASPDRDDPASVIRLHSGNILLTVTADSLGDQLPRVDTPNATVYPQNYGTYRITTSQGQYTEVVVRRGKAEVVTDRSSEVVQAEEAAIVQGERLADVDVESAGSFDALERWGDRLEGEARYADNDKYIDEDLRYSAAPLARHGSWIHHGGRPYWRPRVDVGWRPYWQGRWAYTPAGLNWVSYEPWGWVPYHYGSWDYLPNYGWAWSPGRRWAPAWVYWYWGPSYVGWCPTGHYTSFYRDRYSHFRYGVYGWAGGDWNGFGNHWSFIRHDYFRGYRNGYRDGFKDGRRDHWDVRRYAVPRDELRRREIDRGVITTDTRPLKPDTWNEPRHAIGVLTRSNGNGRGAEGQLPDVTPFVQRRPDLPDQVVRNVVPRDGRDGDQSGQPGVRTRTAERPRNATGGGPLDGAMPTDPSDTPRTARRDRPVPSGGSGSPSASGAPRVRVPREGGVVIDREGDREGERPRAARPQPGTAGGAPRPESSSDSSDRGDRNDSNDRGSEPRVRVPRETPQGGGAPRNDSAVRSRRPEPGESGGAPRPQGGDTGNSGDTGASRPETRQPRESRPPQDEDRNDEVRSRRPEAGQSGGAPRPSRPDSDSPPPSSYRRPDPPQSYDAPRAREQERERESARDRQQEQDRARTVERERAQERERARGQEMERERQQESVRSRERERERESSPPSRPERREAERERGSRGGESGGDQGSQSRSRGSRSRPPGE